MWRSRTAQCAQRPSACASQTCRTVSQPLVSRVFRYYRYRNCCHHPWDLPQPSEPCWTMFLHLHSLPPRWRIQSNNTSFAAGLCCIRFPWIRRIRLSGSALGTRAILFLGFRLTTRIPISEPCSLLTMWFSPNLGFVSALLTKLPIINDATGTLLDVIHGYPQTWPISNLHTDRWHQHHGIDMDLEQHNPRITLFPAALFYLRYYLILPNRVLTFSSPFWSRDCRFQGAEPSANVWKYVI